VRTREDEALKTVISLNDWAVRRAIELVTGSPYHLHVDEPRFVTLAIAAETVIMRWPRRAGNYPGLDVHEVRFPIALLLMEDDELRTWKRRGGRRTEDV
jgi:hypothetical protein